MTLDHYTPLLELDKAKPFDREFRRVTELERKILDEHGLEGAKFLVRRAGGEFTAEGSPWRLEGLAAADAVRRVFAPLHRELPNFIAALTERVRFVFPVRRHDFWELAYVTERALHDGTESFQILFGGAPELDPQLSERCLSTGWIVPASLRKFYAVHDGLGSESYGIHPSVNLVDVGELLDPIAKEAKMQPDGYRFTDLLEVSPDLAGNCQAFHRRRPGDADPPTVDWDHETWEISGERPFFEFADEMLTAEVFDEE